MPATFSPSSGDLLTFSEVPEALEYHQSQSSTVSNQVVGDQQ